MNLNDLLTTYKPSPDPAEYYFDHIFQLYRLGLPLHNPYQKGWPAHFYIQEAQKTLIKLKLSYGEVTEEAFADAKRMAIPEATRAYSTWGQEESLQCSDKWTH